jgi:hypothetical protein
MFATQVWPEVQSLLGQVQGTLGQVQSQVTGVLTSITAAGSGTICAAVYSATSVAANL